MTAGTAENGALEDLYRFWWIMSPTVLRESSVGMGRLSRLRQACKRNAQGRPHTPLSEAQKQKLLTEGYVIVDYSKSKSVFLGEADQARAANDVLDYREFIFNNDLEGGVGDMSRLMRICDFDNLPGRAARMTSGKLLKTFPHLKQGTAAFLLSLEHGHDQMPHTDIGAGDAYLNQERGRILKTYSDNGMVPLSVIMAFEVPAYLHIWPGSHNILWAAENKGSKMYGKRVKIPRYSALVFRQNLVHAGTAYTTQNLRLHFYLDLDVTDYQREANTTFLVDEKFFRKSRR